MKQKVRDELLFFAPGARDVTVDISSFTTSLSYGSTFNPLRMSDASVGRILQDVSITLSTGPVDISEAQMQAMIEASDQMIVNVQAGHFPEFE